TPVVGLLALFSSLPFQFAHAQEVALGGPRDTVPPDGKILFGAWLDDSPAGGDSPALFNSRIGNRASFFQFAQTIPLEDDIRNPGQSSDAMVFLTVYPYFGFANVTQEEIDKLSTQITDIWERTGKRVIIRYAPEMNFEWMPYGQQPAEFISSFRQVATTLHEKNPSAAMLWSPNFDARDGVTYERYYPGDEYVDWVGLSVYYKGTRSNWPWILNTNTPENYFDQLVNAGGSEGGPVPFYDIYAAGKGKPFALSEGAAAFHVNYSSSGALGPFQTDPAAPGVTQTTLQMSSPFKLVCLFEYAKPENESTYLVNRDFRATWDPVDRVANASIVPTTSAPPSISSTTVAPLQTSTATVNIITTSTKPSAGAALLSNAWSVLLPLLASVTMFRSTDTT
ncbi:glycoside hydrolase superfamily, partial [Chytridium lagenaria]